MLFVVDEVICGFGRVGDWFASSRFRLDPDLVTFAKGVTSGYVQLGGVIAGRRVREPFWAEGAGVWRHGYTYSGHATAAAAAHANLDIMERESLCGRALGLETELAAALAPLADHSLVSEVRSGLGVVAAVQLAPEAIAGDASLPDRAALAAREHGVLTRVLVGGGLQISPALVIDDAGLAELVGGLRRRSTTCPRWRPDLRGRAAAPCARGRETTRPGSRGRDPSGRSCRMPHSRRRGR